MSLTIKVHGEYYFKQDSTKGRKRYTLDVRAPSLEFFRQTTVKSRGTDDEGKIVLEEKSYLNVRGILKKRLVPAILERRVNDFARIRSVVIDEVIAENGEVLHDLPLPLMSLAQLKSYIHKKKLPIDSSAYMDIDELRTDIRDCETDEAAFFAGKAKKDKRRAEEKEFLELNQLETPLEVGQQVEEPLPAKKPKTSKAVGVDKPKESIVDL